MRPHFGVSKEPTLRQFASQLRNVIGGIVVLTLLGCGSTKELDATVIEIKESTFCHAVSVFRADDGHVGSICEWIGPIGTRIKAYWTVGHVWDHCNGLKIIPCEAPK